MAQELFERIRGYALTDKGTVRAMNQDTVFISHEPVGVLPNLFIVADGMGGHNAGDLASAEAVRFFVHDIKEHADNAPDVLELMRRALERTNRYVYYMSEESEDYRGMGTTFVVCTIVGYRAFILNVGDSRLYAVTRAQNRPVSLLQITEDHSMVAMMKKAGVITEEEARNHPKKNVITRAIGINEEVQVDTFVQSIYDLHSLLLCSDGLSNMVSDKVLLQIMTDGSSPEERCRKLVRRANENGGKDNISAIVIDFREEEAANV